MNVLLISISLIVIFALATSMTPPPLPNPTDEPKAAIDCAKEHKIPMKEAAGILMGRNIKRKTQNVKCFVHCYFKKFKAMDKEKEKLDKVKNNCDSIKNNDKCVESFQKLKCFHKSAHKKLIPLSLQ
ncbi:uncharacterized protein LOC128262626 [Drosophila gunungcola]|uniref:Uncharacterized protein n=1 Tax=Drosophila gunungcola TaxID=103775 RepID=A0A9P9YUL0_9MUSC|nr:uncharacterized protein LOC128262626 [Drosophila gunungcola]KAI8043362.1 hypothetical protein M5D96_004691 [Drosophila gunungcola]